MPVKLDVVVEEARSLIQKARNAFHPIHGFSTTSRQIYDTAWVAMICKKVRGETRWLFPESFRYLLDMQAEDGSWGRHPRSKTVGILDTAAATLALLRHFNGPLDMQDTMTVDLEQRIKRGLESLQTQLLTWDDLLSTNHIGVELIVPAMLDYLRNEDEILKFELDSQSTLMQMHRAKLTRFQPESLYKMKPSSALHNLEALIGKIDFDRLEHHLFNGSMLASPSSTAAFLMSASSWNDEAEAYPRHVFVAGTGGGSGGFPGTYPTTYFEFNWMLSTLLKGGFSLSDLKCDELFSIGDIICAGFPPRAVDVDDTAKGLLTLSLLGMDECVSPDVMIAMFEVKDHFRTFLGERDPSFTSNCHVLLALLHRSDQLQYLPQIKKTTVYLCNAWWNCDGPIKDKWHLSRLYPTMLLVQAFTELLCQVAVEAIPKETFDQETLSKVPICLFQACLRILMEQKANGSWDSQPEESCYAVLALVNTGRLELFQALDSQTKSAVYRATAFLQTKEWAFNDHDWTSKTAYRSTIVAEAYMLAAMKASSKFSSGYVAAVGHGQRHPPPSKRAKAFVQLIGKTEMFSSTAEWKIQAFSQESALFVPLLRTHRLRVLDRDHIGVSTDHYLDMIPFTWIGCNNRSRTYASNSFLFEMMIISMLGYQVDEFMEAVASPAFRKNTGELHHLIDNVICETNDTFRALTAQGIRGMTWSGPRYGLYEQVDTPEASAPAAGNEPVVDDPLNRGTTKEFLRRFFQYVLNHPHVRNASFQDQSTLWREMRAFMHAHVIQIADNARRAGPLSGRTFLDWVRTTAADHVACAYSFAFACCMISASLGGGDTVFAAVKEIYLAEAVTRHMATMCRMCNDIGSVERDSTEGNTNSVDFPEFANGCPVSVQKAALSELAAYERTCLMYTIDKISKGSTFRSEKWKLCVFFADVTDLYDQLYIIRDLSSTLK
ncbi:Ent-kaur-16-ene synthase [Paraphoma chrysanthemicola]|nr:Ent-kaur-16-ene synthase [Paraphoma chrysanthemicola]